MSSPFKMNSPFKNLNRWFKEEWETPSGEKIIAKEKILLDLLTKYQKIPLKLGARLRLLLKLKRKKKKIQKEE
tara:strand:+ start:470 stop:688 length:219 start_codon:yes stop_codon:yes gene_type:complete